MTTVFMADPATGNVALFDEAPGGGDPADPASLRNRPLLDNMEVVSDTTITVSHAAITAASNTTGVELASAFDYDAGLTDHDLVTHGLGYEPLALVAVGGELLTPGQPVQGPGTTAGTVRYVSPWVTGSKVRLREFGSRGTGGLAAIDIDYRVLVFRQPRGPSGNRLIDFDPDAGVLSLGFDRFNSDRRYLQVVPGGTPFGLCLGRTADAKNGAPRFVSADGTIFDPVSSATKMGIKASSEGSVTYGAAMNYTGSFAGGGAILVQAP